MVRIKYSIRLISNVKRIYYIVSSLALMALGVLLTAIGLSGWKSGVDIGPFFYLCPIGFAVFCIGGVLFLFVRRGNVP
jgi:hypothetical protein